MRQYLLIPGPTPLPQRVIQAMSRDMISHRGKEYGEIFGTILSSMKDIVGTKEGEILFFPSSGTGGLEAALVNSFNPHDEVLSLSCGYFGDRFRKIAESYGIKVNKMNIPWGKTPDSDKIYEFLKKNSNIKGVLVTHNETSTGVMVDLSEIGRVLKEFPNILYIVDGVSSVGAIPVNQDENGIDIVITSSQKALMTPPGISLLSVSKKALDVSKRSKLPKYYFDFSMALSYQKRDIPQNPYTPPVSLVYGLLEALKMIEEEGLENRFKRHKRMRDMVRAGFKALGFELVADDKDASFTVTAIFVPQGEDKKIITELKNRYNIIISKGQGEFAGRVIRIGHMGATTYSDLLFLLSALENIVNPTTPGISLQKAQEVLNSMEV